MSKGHKSERRIPSREAEKVLRSAVQPSPAPDERAQLPPGDLSEDQLRQLSLVLRRQALSDAGALRMFDPREASAPDGMRLAMLSKMCVDAAEDLFGPAAANVIATRFRTPQHREWLRDQGRAIEQAHPARRRMKP